MASLPFNTSVFSLEKKEETLLNYKLFSFSSQTSVNEFGSGVLNNNLNRNNSIFNSYTVITEKNESEMNCMKPFQSQT